MDCPYISGHQEEAEGHGFRRAPAILTCAGRSPPPVLDGIQLSGLPWSPAGPSSTTFGLAPRGSAVSSRIPPTSRSPHHRMMGRVSFLFWSRPSLAAPLGAARPAPREELPQEIPVARPPARVGPKRQRCPINRFQIPKGSLARNTTVHSPCSPGNSSKRPLPKWPASGPNGWPRR
jgi:hypothetical protein